jgi:hypothetical protein
MVNGHFFDPLAFLGISLGHRFSYAFLMVLSFRPGAVFLAILRKRSHRVFGRRAHLNPQTVNGFLFGVLTHQFYSYWIRGEFLG